jgi:hypothetical protein
LHGEAKRDLSTFSNLEKEKEWGARGKQLIDLVESWMTQPKATRIKNGDCFIKIGGKKTPSHRFYEPFLGGFIRGVGITLLLR